MHKYCIQELSNQCERLLFTLKSNVSETLRRKLAKFGENMF